MSSSSNKTMTLVNYKHGQSMEMFTFDGKEYMVISAGSIGDKLKLGNKVSFVEFRAGKEPYVFGVKGHDKDINAKTLTHIGRANKGGKSKGTPKQVEVALSEDKSTLLVWCRMANKSKEGRKHQVTCYNLKKVMKKLKEIEKKNKKKKKNARVTLNCKNLKSACITSALQSDKNQTIVKPNDSCQAVDITNMKDGKCQVYITGGNHGEKKNRKLAVAVMELKKGKKPSENSTYLCKTPIKVKKNIMGEKLEMEGMHYKNGILRMAIAPASGAGGKERQYVFELEASKVK